MQNANEAPDVIPSGRRVRPRSKPPQAHATRMSEKSLRGFRLLLLAIYLNGSLLLVALILDLTTATTPRPIPIFSRIENPPTEVLALALFLQGMAFLWCLPDAGLLMGSFVTKMRCVCFLSSVRFSSFELREDWEVVFRADRVAPDWI